MARRLLSQPLSPELRLAQDQARARIARAASAAKRKPDDPSLREAVDVARRDYAATTLEDFARHVVAEWPPLTEDQRDRIALILRGDSDV